MSRKWVRPGRSWTITQIGTSKDYVITYADKYIPMTGSAVNTDFGILKAHKLKKIELKHTDSAKADSTDNLKITIQRRMELLEALLKKIYEDAVGTVKSDTTIEFDPPLEYLAQYYRLTLNTTNTDRVYPEIYIEVLED